MKRTTGCVVAAAVCMSLVTACQTTSDTGTTALTGSSTSATQKLIQTEPGKNANAHAELAYRYWRGRGVDVDRERAYFWSSLAVEGGAQASWPDVGSVQDLNAHLAELLGKPVAREGQTGTTADNVRRSSPALITGSAGAAGNESAPRIVVFVERNEKRVRFGAEFDARSYIDFAHANVLAENSFTDSPKELYWQEGLPMRGAVRYVVARDLRQRESGAAFLIESTFCRKQSEPLHYLVLRSDGVRTAGNVAPAPQGEALAALIAEMGLSGPEMRKLWNRLDEQLLSVQQAFQILRDCPFDPVGADDLLAAARANIRGLGTSAGPNPTAATYAALEGLRAAGLGVTAGRPVMSKEVRRQQAKRADLLQDPGPMIDIGVTFLPGDCPCEIATVERGSSAAQAGLRRGDVVVRYSGRRVESMDHMALWSALVGAAGYPVKLAVSRGGAAPEWIDIPRIKNPGVQVKQPKVGATQMFGAIGYIRVSQLGSAFDLSEWFFRTGSPKSFPAKRVLDKAFGRESPEALVVDLRGVSASENRVVVGLVSLFIDGGRFAKLENAAGEAKEISAASGQVPGWVPRSRLVVVVDGATAGSAEALAQALRVRNGAILIGQPTAGEETVKFPYKLANGETLWVPRVRYVPFTTEAGTALFDGTPLDPDSVIDRVGDLSARELTDHAVKALD